MASQEGAVVETHVTPSKYSKRVVLNTIFSRSDEGLGLVGMRLVIGGWVKSSKEERKEPPPSSGTAGSGVKDDNCLQILQTHIPILRSIMKILFGNDSPVQLKLDQALPKPAPPSVAYLQVNDGSCVQNLQVVVDSSKASLSQLTAVGTSIMAEGILLRPSVAGKHVTELKVEKILHIGTVDHANYPLSKKKLPFEILRNYSHFRPRTITVASVTRIRSSLTHATHTFFENNGFLYVHLPVITTTNCEGTSETFHATTLLSKWEFEEESKVIDEQRSINLESIKAAMKEKSNIIEELQKGENNKEALIAAVQDLQKTKELALELENKERMKPGTLSKPGNLDFSMDFFSKETYLTVSGQLHLESYASSLGNVYSFGPIFRTEKSPSKKHLAETWMVEVEVGFSEIEDVINCVEDYLNFLCQWIGEKCSEDLKFLSKRVNKNLVDQISSMASSSFKRISYEDAIDSLKKVTDKTFEAKTEWGAALTEEHERYLADEIYKNPVVIYNYPKEVKPFYMRLNDDAKTVAAFDVVLPKGGTFIRGGQREERIDMLQTRIKELGLPKEKYEWYLDLRRHGTVKHSGFSLGFDHMVFFATGLYDIRDVIPFPRSHGNISN